MSDAQRNPASGEAATADGASSQDEPLGQKLGIDDVQFDEERAATDPSKAAGQAAESPEPAEPVAPQASPASNGAITVNVVGRTDVGLVREHNEDNFLLADLSTGSRDASTFHEVPAAGLVLGVCDGMGGAAAGEVASQMAVDTVFEMMRRSVPASDRDALARTLVRSIEEAGARIFESARADRSRRGMGTTSTIATIMDRTLFVGQVGDSRAYILRNGELKQITKDQSLVNQLIEAGQLTEAEAEAFEHSNIILQALGTTDQVTVDLTFLELRRGDRLLICSDGLSGLVHGDVIREVMVEYRDLNSCCERLIELAKAGGGHDNVTVILCEFGGEGLAAPAPTDLAGYQQYPLPLGGDGRSAGQLNSDLPTLAPPSERSGAHSGFDELGDFRGASRHSRASTRYVLLVLLVLGAAGAVYYFTGNTDKSSASSEVPPDPKAPLAVAAEPPPRVEVVVRTDVEGGELFVDGESFGTGTDGRWVLDLAPGPHRLDARAAGSLVTTSLVTVREGIPATVLLSLPEGSTGTADAAAEQAAAEPSPEQKARAEAERKLREERRAARRRRRAADAGAVIPPPQGTPQAP